MEKRLQVRGNTLGRVEDFLRAYPLGDGPGDELIARYQEKLDRLEVLMQQQRDGEVHRKAENGRRRLLQEKIVFAPLRHVARVATSLGPEHAGVAATLGQKVRGIGMQNFLTTVRSITTTLTEHHDVLRAQGMEERALQELGELLAEYEQAVRDANEARRAHTGARAEMVGLTRELMQMVRQLEGIVEYRFQDNLEVLGAWKSARNVAWPVGEAVKPAIRTQVEEQASR